MTSLSLSDHSVFPKKYLIILFVAAFVLLSIFNLPAGIIGGWLRNTGLNYRSIEGTLWQVEIYDAIFDGYPIHKLELEPKIGKLLLFQLAAGFKAENNQGQITGTITSAGQGDFILNDIHASANVIVSKNTNSFPTDFILNSDQLKIGENGQCRAGNFMIKSNLTDLLFSGLALELPPLSGQGQCDDGNINMTLQTSGQGFEISLSGELNEQASKAMINIKLPESLNDLPRVTNELSARGFTKANGFWQTVMEIDR
ncbi:MAG: type II secretion system protein N [Emcibacteraceae bacterium]